jgi:hypothetical protein
VVPSVRRAWRPGDVVLSAIFLTVIALPALQLLVAPKAIVPLTDKQASIPRPPLVWTPSGLQFFHRNFEHYWNHAFGLRPALVRGWNAMAVAFGVSPSDQVVIGKAGWWFVGDQYRAVEYQRAVRPFAPEQLERWQRVLEARRAWLAARGIDYVFVVAPDKGSIYPQYLPATSSRVGPLTRLEQLVRHLAEHSDFRIVDVAPAVRAMAERQPAYEPLDSHWNDLGAWVAYVAIAERLDLTPEPLDGFEMRRIPGQGNDLALLLSLGDRQPASRLGLVPRVPRRAHWLSSNGALPLGSQGVYISEIDDASLPSAVVFQDSFGEALRPFLSEHFRRTFHSWQVLFDPVVVEQERPSVVIQEMVERSLMEDFPPDPDVVTQALAQPVRPR